MFSEPSLLALAESLGQLVALNESVIPAPLYPPASWPVLSRGPNRQRGGRLPLALRLGRPGPPAVLFSASENTGFLGLEVSRRPVTPIRAPSCTRSAQLTQSGHRLPQWGGAPSPPPYTQQHPDADRQPGAETVICPPHGHPEAVLRRSSPFDRCGDRGSGIQSLAGQYATPLETTLFSE